MVEIGVHVAWVIFSIIMTIALVSFHKTSFRLGRRDWPFWTTVVVIDLVSIFILYLLIRSLLGFVPG